jgi:hypothetical protein
LTFPSQVPFHEPLGTQFGVGLWPVSWKAVEPATGKTAKTVAVPIEMTSCEKRLRFTSGAFQKILQRKITNSILPAQIALTPFLLGLQLKQINC